MQRIIVIFLQKLHNASYIKKKRSTCHPENFKVKVKNVKFTVSPTEWTDNFISKYENDSL